jgi:hypothetical protein
MLFTIHHCPPLCQNLPEGYELLQLVTPAMITNVWTELEYRYDMCWTTYGTLIKHLKTVNCRSQAVNPVTYQNMCAFIPMPLIY